MSAEIHLAGLVVERDGAPVVRGVDLDVNRAAWFGLIGANGSGKTTLLRAVAGRLPIGSGACRIGGKDLAPDRAGRAERIAFAPPGEKLPETLRVRDVLTLIAGDLDLALARLGALRSALQVDPLLDHWIGSCSAGMRQRVAIAAAFAEGKSTVILDEPFNWLDPVAAFDVKMALRAMVDGGLTLVTALHDLATLSHNCDDGAMMADGRIALRLGRDDLASAQSDLPAFEQQMIEALRSGG